MRKLKGIPNQKPQKENFSMHNVRRVRILSQLGLQYQRVALHHSKHIKFIVPYTKK